MENEFKGTKGKWIVDTEHPSIYSTSDIKGNIICDAPVEWELSMEKWGANAKLIACAPEMLEFIKNHYRFLNIKDQKKAEKLIKKATL